MIFSLEALQADAGDALILHYGDDHGRSLSVIDGGPTGIYTRSLKPRLDELRAQTGPDPLPIELLLISHLDDDHINGIVDLLDALAERQADNTELPYRIGDLWHNSFADIAKEKPGDLSLGAEALERTVDADAAAVIASVGQGVEVRTLAEQLALRVNVPFGELVTFRGPEASTTTLAHGLKVHVLAPSQRRVDDLRERWHRERQKSRDAAKALAAAFEDRSVFNLSSIVTLCELGDRKMLLTGDARGDDILDGLKEAGFLGDEPLALDLLKVPHHGSDRNVTTDFFRCLPAQHYVISADGKHDNPETSTLKMIMAARGNAPYTIHLTNRTGKGDLEARLGELLTKLEADGQQDRLAFRANDELSLRVDLGDPLEDRPT